MRTTNYFYSIVLLAILMIGCNKTEDGTGEDNDCDGVCETVAFNTMEAFFEENGVEEQIFTANATDGTTITGDKGTIISIPRNAFINANGAMVTGNVDVTIKEIFTPSEMILSNRPTNAINSLGERTFLFSEGETEIVVEQNGEKLSLATNMGIQIKVPAAGGEDFTTGAFIGDIDEDDNIVWNQFGNTEVYFQSAPDSYIYTTFDTGWTNCDRFVTYPGDKTTNYIDLTTSPNKDETRIFMVYEDNNLPAVVGFTQEYADGLQSYVNSLPVGIAVTLVGLTIKDNQQYMAVETMTVSENTSITLTFSAVSTDNIMDALALLN